MPASGPRLTIFASDRGPGDAERASIMSQAGTYLARRGARLVCLVEGDGLPMPLITAARAAGGEVEVIADTGMQLPAALDAVTITVIPDPQERMAYVADNTDAYVGLPGSLVSVSSLFRTWSATRKESKARPVVLLNRNRAFEVLRGYSADVLSHGLRGYDRSIQFADSVEDLWIRASRMIAEAG